MKNIFSSITVKKVLATLFFIFIFILGSRLTLPFVDMNNREFLGGTAAYLAFSTAMTGGNLRSLSLFSVGLSPWMSSMILWQMLSFSKKLNLTSGAIEIQNRRQMYLTLFIALIQALAISLNLPIQSNVPKILVIVLNTCLLIAGAFFLVWLSDINATVGIGGSMIILLIGMILNIPQDLIETFRIVPIPLFVLIGLIIMGIVFTYLVALLYRARYRIPVHKIGLRSRFKRYSFLEIMLNPAGGMPFMYVMSFLSLPTYIFLLLQTLFPHTSVFSELSAQYGVGKPLWIYSYIAMIFLFSIAFAFVNLSGDQISDRMKKSGEYIYGVYPGEETSRFINRLVLRFSIIGGTFNVLMAGTPMLFVLSDEKLLRIAMIPGLFMMFGGMIFTIKDEMKALRLNETYKPLI
ncbi:accessory Sec system protein translocase subunit SecY2 [Streptococcus mitis]|uniref:Accessory Sec system protein translocase subunit SecY2 n=1 Tax=Streptococcus mitis TaxID=28037 RepID=A0A6L5H1F2_STRMT|nr:accessory Sec system protein translocase subunit SecY2 [Streptococcus mitis]MQP59198.1 accessory Sec system protein translocase subunit SecY2 [Streptococcus mitis]MQP68882.1 accessory Sec system protein translocase subunit SecY2 [Streptococcus mitis]MQP70758.1 accessory Sec system protein translocase subunit SecY2 [Streptococcus mitis]MQP73931.1 accessory Sec system protein translocase subunit SecY2 [Streptococcus mitis]MQP86453.1 accessory Sec system protein translocase subunit SecY2 [Stre